MTCEDKIAELHNRLRKAETHLEHLAITRKTITTLADRLPTGPASLHCWTTRTTPRILAAFHESTCPLRARDVCQARDHEVLPKNIEGTRAKLKRLVKLDVLTEINAGSFARKQ